MRILGGLLGGKNSVKQALQDLLSELSGDGVSSKVWDRCRTADTLEDFIDEELPRERLVALATAHTKNVYGLAHFCVESMESALALEGESFDEAAEISLANSMTVLCHLLAAGPAGASAPPDAANASTNTGSLAEKPERPPHPLAGLLWEKPMAALGKEATGKSTQWFSLEENPPLAERILNATMRSLFFDGFTVDLKDKDEDGEGNTGKSQGDVDPNLLWSGHVGPESEFEQEPADDEVRENRTLALQLLLAMVCGAAPAIALKEQAEEEAKAAAAKPQQRGRTAQRDRSKEDKAALFEAAAAVSQAMSKPLIVDLRALAYLQNAERSVPYRAELLYSLLSVSLDYNPRGMGVPLAGLFRGSKEESFISVSMQVLDLLLQDACESECPAESAIVSRRPQELLGHPEAWPLPPVGPAHFFRHLLSELTSEREVVFIFSGIVNLLGSINEEQRAYLPGSVRVPAFLPELLVLVYHLAAIDCFVKGFCSNDDCGAPAIAEVLVAYAFQETPEHLQEDIIPAIAMAVLLRLTAYREFCDQLNEAFDGDQPDELPEFTGNFADAVALTALKQAADKIQYAQVSNISRCTVEAALCTLDNISTFTEGFCMESCFRLFALLERCGKPSMVKRGRNGLSIWMPRILEAVQNAVQYQYAPNTDMVYGLMTRQAMLIELERLVAKAVPSKAEASSEGAGEDPSKAEKSENGHSVPADGDGSPSAAASTSDEALPEMPAEWWASVKASLEPIVMLLREVTPHVEAEVERREIASPEEAKKFLPRTALGLLPVPHAFVSRSIRGNALIHRICEHCLVASVATGPVGGLWEESEDAGDSAGSDHKEPEEEKKEKPAKKGASDRKRSSSRRARSVERARSRDPRDRRSPPRGGPAAASSSGAAQPVAAANPAPVDTASALKAQLEAAAAAGVDVKMLLQQLSQGAPASAAAPAAPAAPAAASAPAAPAASPEEEAATSEPAASAPAPPPPPPPPAPEEKADEGEEGAGGAQADDEAGI